MNKELKDKIIELWENESDGVEVIDNGDWTSDMKYQFRETIIKYEGMHYLICQSRSGSYHSDYEYYDPEIYEVVPKVITKTEWVRK